MVAARQIKLRSTLLIHDAAPFHHRSVMEFLAAKRLDVQAEEEAGQGAFRLN
jgi:hypothetical protein